MGLYLILSNLVFRGPKVHPEVMIAMLTTALVWHRARATYCTPEPFSPHVPLWGNPLIYIYSILEIYSYRRSAENIF